MDVFVVLNLTILAMVSGTNSLEIFTFLYTRSNPRVAVQGFEDGKVDTSKPLKILIHGWLGTTFFTIYSDMKDELLRNEDCNVIIFDWSKNNGEYLKTVLNTRLVGNLLGNTLFYLYDHYDQIHLIGQGLGAHLAGFAGKVIQKYSLGKHRIGRISGLDPTLPQFNGTSPADRLDRTDATVVDVYHCDSYRFGFGDPIGSIDFYPNGGVAPMPTCNDSVQPLIKLLYGAIEEVFCSHAKCRTYFKTSIQTKDITAIKCDSWSNYNSGLCDGNEKIVFGENVSLDARGTFYLNLTLA